MGVPAFFRWLTLRYPKILLEAREDLDIGLDLNKLIMDNVGEERLMPSIDNLYFDMNGIIHPCAHPEDRDAPSSLAEMFNSIFDYCDKIIRIIRPKKLIYLAIDGVAPRAKMNQQRSRRFRAAIDAEQKERISRKIEKEWRDKGLSTDFLDIKKKQKFKFDSNYITPGTEFLAQCSNALKQYIKSRINNDPLWKNLNVIFSDASVPGEGEHKILDFIRTQRTYDNYDPNTYHCIYGADADLIMLSLIMHEPHFCVIRESLNEKYYLICEKCKKHGHTSEECHNMSRNFNRSKATEKEIYQYNKKQIDEIEFSLLKIEILREYLELEFKDLVKKFNFERIIDDFVFLCFLVGNDFLPNLPSLKIREGAIDALIYLYKKILPQMKNFLTNGKGQLNLKECEILFRKLSKVEDEFFKIEIKNKTNDEKHKKNNQISSEKNKKNTFLNDFHNITDNKNNIDNLISYNEDKYNQIIKEEIYEENNKIVGEYIDKIKLGERGWKDRYYMEKFHISNNNDKRALKEFKEKIKKYYVEGLCWVFEYYYNGCISWSWFYPYHYAPFASDLTNLKEIKINFELSEPFLAFEQLLSVLPPYSAGALPSYFKKLMTNPLSPIADFYPSDVKLDINNQPYAWMGVNLLPFVDEERIHKIVRTAINKGKLNKKEMKLNERGNNLLISNDKEISKYIEGELKPYDFSFEEDISIKGIFPGKVKEDKSQIFIFEKKINNKNHNSIILNGVKPHKKCIIEDNLDNYPKTKFKGKQAIEIVQRILGYTDENVENYFLHETFDERFGNNNRGVEYEPKKMFLLKKKRYNDRNKSNNLENNNTRSRSRNRNRNRDTSRNNSNRINNIIQRRNIRNYSNNNNTQNNKSRYNYKFKRNNFRNNNSNNNDYNYRSKESRYSSNSINLKENSSKKNKRMENRKTKKKNYNLRYKK